MGSESVAHEAEGEWGIDSEAMWARGIIVLVKKIIETKHLALAARFKFFFGDKTIQFVTGGL